MKRIVSILLVVVMTFSLAACGSNADAPKETEGGSAAAEKETAETETETEKPDDPMANQVAIILQEGGLGDQGYNDGAKIGFDQMVEKYGIDGVLVEATAASEADTFIRQLAEEGYPLIICLDWVIIDYVRTASADYPDTTFVVLGKGLPGPGTQENLIEPFTALHEWAFMASAAMIEVSKDENVMFDWQLNNPGVTIASISPGESVNAPRSRAAEQQIRQWYKDNEGLDVICYNDYTGSYTDSALNQQIAENLVTNMGVEAFWPMVGTGALATFSSVLHNTTMMVINMIEEWQAGTLNGTNEYYWGVESGVVGVTDMSTVKGVEGCDQEAWARIRGALDDWEERIISGEFIVYNYFLEQEYNENAGDFDTWQAAHPGVDYTEWVKAGRPE